MNPPLRCAVAGLGVGWRHAEMVEALPDARLVAVADLDDAVRTRASLAFPSSQVHVEATELLERRDVDVLIVATYDADHGRLIASAIDSSMHCFVEKPLCTTVADLRAITNSLNRRPHVRMTTNTLLRRSPRFQWLNDQISGGELGSIYHFEADYMYGRLDKLLYGWRGTSHEYSPTLGGAIHVLDLVMWLQGEVPSIVHGVGSGRAASILRDSQLSGYRGHDLHLGLLTFDTGVTAKIGANFACVSPHFHRLEVYGTEATFMHGLSGSQGQRSQAWIYRSRDPAVPPKPVELPYPAVRKTALLEEFLQAVRGEGPIPISEREVIDVAAVALGIDSSVRSGQPVKVDYPVLTPRD